MLKRTITGAIGTLCLIPVFIWSDTWVLPIIVSLVALLGCYEMVSCIGQKKNLFISVPIYIEAVFFPLFVRYCHNRDNMDFFVLVSVFCILGTILYVLAVAVFMNEKIAVTDAGLWAATAIYIIAAATCIVYVRDFIEPGIFMFLLCIISAFVTDIFAYFTGMLFGKHKLIPSVSPKKTIEGAVGGVVFCVIFFVVYGIIIELTTEYEANYFVLAVAGVIVSVVSQIGDLIMSLIKRKFGIKDYGKIFPGHGGILDRCDSILAVTTVVAIICTFFDMFQ